MTGTPSGHSPGPPMQFSVPARLLFGLLFAAPAWAQWLTTVQAQATATSGIVSWTSAAPATTQVKYGNHNSARVTYHAGSGAPCFGQENLTNRRP